MSDPEIQSLIHRGLVQDLGEGSIVLAPGVGFPTGSFYIRELCQHQHHASFQHQSWAFSLEVGFTCACSGEEQEWRVSLHELRQLNSDDQLWYERVRQHSLNYGCKKKRREARLAVVRAKALLHRHLTKQQRWELRAKKAFTVQGSDGNTYLITEGTANNVKRVKNGRPDFSLCVVSDYNLPVYDLMLAQKLLLETNAPHFVSLANIFDLAGRPLPTANLELGLTG